MARTAPIIFSETVELDAPPGLEATASSAWVNATELVMKILERESCGAAPAHAASYADANTLSRPNQPRPADVQHGGGQGFQRNHKSPHGPTRDYCWDHGIAVPPFHTEIRQDVGPKSVLYGHGNGNMDVLYKLNTRNLQTILKNVLLLGDRLYGTGKSAKYTLKAVKEIEEAEGQVLDCKVREHRLPLDAELVPELALLKTEEDQSLFWAAAKKWLPHDLRAIRDARYSIHPSAWPINKEQSAGKPNSGKQGRHQNSSVGRSRLLLEARGRRRRMAWSHSRHAVPWHGLCLLQRPPGRWA